MPAAYTLEKFTERAKKLHNNLYDYSKVKYINMHTNVCIIDPEYGEFWQAPMTHLNGSGHKTRGYELASKKRRMGKEEFVNKATKLHGELYDYSKVKYTHIDCKVLIIDPDYGEFWQSPYQHLNSHGCPQRTADKEYLVHVDHIVPLSIIKGAKRNRNKWWLDRPLYKFLDSDINKKEICAKANTLKSDIIEVNGISIDAGSVRNNYKIISLLIKEKLNFDATEIINEDIQYIDKLFDIKR